MNYSSIFFLFPIGIRPLLAALPDLPGVRPLSLRRADLLTIELMQELNIVMPITWDVWTAFNNSPETAFIYRIDFYNIGA